MQSTTTKRAKLSPSPTSSTPLAPIETPRSPLADPTAETPRGPAFGGKALDSTFEKWADIADQYHLERILGSGSYGEVASAIDKKTGERTAIKVGFSVSLSLFLPLSPSLLKKN